MGGGAELTNVAGIATPKLGGSAAGLPVPSGAPIASIPIGASAPLTFGAAAAYAGDGTWTTEYTLASDQGGSETNTANNTIEVPGTVIGGNEFARWEGAVTGSIGIGAGTGGELGVALTIPADMLVGGARFAMLPIPPQSGDPPSPSICPGFDFVVNLREFDTVNNVPGAIIDSTVPVPCEYDQGGSYDVAFAGGRHLLPAGTYVLTAVEQPGGPTLPLPLHDQRFVVGTTWVTWPSLPGGGWAHFEDFGASFMRTPELSLLSAESSIFADGFDGVAPPAPMMQTVRKAAPVVQPARPMRSVAPTRLVQAKR